MEWPDLPWLKARRAIARHLGLPVTKLLRVAPWARDTWKRTQRFWRPVLDVASYRHVVRWAHEIGERPAVKRGRAVNRVWGPEDTRLPARHLAADVDAVVR